MTNKRSLLARVGLELIPRRMRSGRSINGNYVIDTGHPACDHRRDSRFKRRSMSTFEALRATLREAQEATTSGPSTDSSTTPAHRVAILDR